MKEAIEFRVKKIVAVLEKGDCDLKTLTHDTGLSPLACERAVNYLKGRSRIENVDGLLHLRPETPTPDPALLVQAHDAEMGEAAIQGYEEAWHEDIQPPSESASESNEPTYAVDTDMILSALDVTPGPANPKTIAAVIQEQGEIMDPFPTLGAALATALMNHQIDLVGHDEEGYPLYEASPVTMEAPAVFEPLPEFDPEVERESVPLQVPPHPDVKTIVIGDVTYRLPYADLFPPLAFGDRASLEVSIRRFGIKKEIDVCQPDPGNNKLFDVLDGMNRLEIAVQQGITFIPFRIHLGLDARDQLELAWSLNADRRQLTFEQRQQWAVKFRERGESLRSIAAKLHVDHKTVANDLEKAAATGEYSPVDTVTGLDGKAHPATKPDPTKTQQAADEIYAQFAGQAHVGYEDIQHQFPRLDPTLRIKATGLLEIDGRASAVKGYPGTYKFAPLPTPEPAKPAEPIPGTAALMETLKDFTPAPVVEPPSMPQESAEPAAKSEPPALPPGLTFEQLHAPAHSDDHDPDLAAAVLLRANLDKLALDLLDAIDRFEHIRSIRSLALLDSNGVNATTQLLRVVHGRAQGAATHADELSRQLVEAVKAKTEEAQA